MRVITDTTTYAPPEMLSELGIVTIDLYVGWDGDLRPEGEYTDLRAFYERLAGSDRLPTTSQPSVGDFLEIYRPRLEAGEDVVSIHIAESLSGTCASARAAAAELEEEGHTGAITVIDGATGAAGLGCLAIAAARAAAEGADAAAVAATVREAHERLDIWFCLDTLEYLRRGGRIGAAQALVGGALQIKPILTFAAEITPVGRVRTHSKAIQRMEEYLRELRDRGARDWVVQHAQSEDDATHLAELGTELIGVPPLFKTEVGPVLGAHLGAGVLVGGLAAGGPADSGAD